MKPRFKHLAVVLWLGLIPLSCAVVDTHDPPVQNMRVSSMRKRLILDAVWVLPRGQHVVDLMLSPVTDANYARFKKTLGLSAEHDYARSVVQLELSPDGTVQKVIGTFKVQVGHKWEFVPEVQKVPTFRPSQKLTTEILSRLSAMGLL